MRAKAPNVIAEALRDCGVDNPERVEVMQIMDALRDAGYVIVDAFDIDNVLVRLGGSFADSRGRLILAAREVIARCPHQNTYTSVDGLRERCYRCNALVAEYGQALIGDTP